ncbi:ABC transporter ATP-binding protein [Sulfuricurvum sp.]|uniref:ABC transporter ATP-binding protein n=1 Tax=Sulfuricurvum sp. TaxID=2025608 RepID=UPI00261C367A|nr:ABC transporter ATP-binding protein [Sulfuricurvum sp.]MDD2266034.1 ABC transporter ATP-binding protein [Sulfuricurvum sp.]MDD2783046.1 ABC transporter ATP-binding protein [Sulfuricurvum sp.]
MILLELSNITKAYRVYTSEFHRFLSWFVPSVSPVEETRVLDNLNLTIKQGESIGIVGQNGAGKSTLLKLITGIIRPTSGTIGIHGKIAAILELGMGFNADFTGRQNAYNALGIMGFTHDQITAIIPEVEAFAEIGHYFDLPLRIYSSGMQMRVAFSVATAYRPDILIVDEALSVGDAYFQHKSFARIKEFKELGTTLLLVSHDETAIQNICDRALLLEKGTIVHDGNPEDILNYYKASIAEKEKNTIKMTQLDNGRIQIVSGSGEARIRSLTLTNEKGVETDTFYVGRKFQMSVMVDVHEYLDSLVFGFSIKDRLGQIMYGTNTWYTKQNLCEVASGTLLEYTVSFDLCLGVGNYSIQLALHDQETHLNRNYEWIDMAGMFTVLNEEENFFIGLSWLNPDIRMKTIETFD